MAHRSFTELAPTERAEFVSACGLRGLSPNDFLFSIEESIRRAPVGRLHRNAHVLRKSNMRGRVYGASFGRGWTRSFATDLARGCFD